MACSRSMDAAAAQAIIRFGLGRRGSENPPSDPKSWLLGQLAGSDRALSLQAPGVAEALEAARLDRAQPPDPGIPSRQTVMWIAEQQAMMDRLATTDTPFRERLVWFWANHFTVSHKRADVALIGPYLREAIRPHVTGRFVDMLLAVMTHPAILIYLDNRSSVGPNSKAGLKNHAGLNENLARECLELHTVGVAAGYTQADVTAFAAVLTGWMVEPNPPAAGFVFHVGAHEPGAKTVMGKTFPEGMEGGITALTWLADHPATHRRLATALARHFVADAPPPASVSAIEVVLRDTHGDLGDVARALVALPTAWTPSLAKLRDPFDFVVATMRALDLPPEQRAESWKWPEQLGQGLFAAPLPNGWADVAGHWSGGEELLRRADWVWSVTGRAGDRDPNELLQDSLGPFATATTTDTVRRAGSRREGLTLLLAGPEFQRR